MLTYMSGTLFGGKESVQKYFGVDYLFRREISNLKEVDNFVLSFLDRF